MLPSSSKHEKKSATDEPDERRWNISNLRSSGSSVADSGAALMPYDVVTFGEAMIRLSPPNFRRLEQARTLDLQVGGAELNTAVALARLGRSSSWVSRLTDNPLGRLIANHAREAGVGVKHVVWTGEDRVGLYFLEFGAAPRASSVLYDRRGAAIAAIRPGMIDWRKVFSGARWFHVTGITPALSASA